MAAHGVVLAGLQMPDGSTCVVDLHLVDESAGGARFWTRASLQAGDVLEVEAVEAGAAHFEPAQQLKAIHVTEHAPERTVGVCVRRAEASVDEPK